MPKVAVRQEKPKTVRYVEFLFPGSFFSESSVQRYKPGMKIPDRCFGYQFFDKTSTKVGSETLEGRPKNFKGRYYLGKVYSQAEVKKMKLPGFLAENMETNGWAFAVKCRTGNWQPFEKKDKIVTGTTVIF